MNGKKVMVPRRVALGELTGQQLDLLVCQHLGEEVWPCGILQIITAMEKLDRQVQLRFTLALRLALVDQTASASALIQLHQVLFGMTVKLCKEAALRALGVVDKDGYLVDMPEFQGQGGGNGVRAGDAHTQGNR
jgi:hypothetical protein